MDKTILFILIIILIPIGGVILYLINKYAPDELSSEERDEIIRFNKEKWKRNKKKLMPYYYSMFTFFGILVFWVAITFIYGMTKERFVIVMLLLFSVNMITCFMVLNNKGNMAESRTMEEQKRKLRLFDLWWKTGIIFGIVILVIIVIGAIMLI